jgi:hypothetical protein
MGLKLKMKHFAKFWMFKALVETKMGHRIKVLQTDRGREFTTKVFLEYCEKQDVSREDA